MQNNSRAPHYGTHVLSVRTNDSAYSSLHRLIIKAGYTGLASFASVSARIACDLVDVCSLEVHYECTEKLSEFTERKTVLNQ